MTTTLASLAAAALVRFEWAVIAFFLVVNAWYLLLLGSATLEMRRHANGARGRPGSRATGSRLLPTISVLAPHRDEESKAVEAVAALLALQYPNLEVVVINDGSRDASLEALREHFQLVPVHPIYRRRIVTRAVRGLYRSGVYPNLVVIDKDRGGKADALNAGLNVASGALVCAVDTGMLIEADALQRMVRPFLEYDNVLATGGSIRIANGCTIRGGRVADARVPGHPLAAFQVVEYMRTFLFGRLGWNRLGGNLILSGAFGLMRRDAVIDVGGYADDTVVEDMELVLRLRRRGHETRGPRRIEFVPDPVAWTLAPESTTRLGRQRAGWQRGLADALWKHRAVAFNPRYGTLGLVLTPWFLLVELLAPLVELLGVLGLALGLALGLLDPAFAVLFLLAAYGLGAVLTVFTIAMDELSFQRYPRMGDRVRLVLWALAEPLGYRQLIVLWRLLGLETWLRQESGTGADTTGEFRRPVNGGPRLVNPLRSVSSR
jgi:cellulose synthase/poly-beta-1,6-N-acetylglucosamine synthase-like glycosyltransferase